MAHIDRYRILGQTLSLQSPSQAVAGAFRHLLSGFASDEPSPPSSLYRIDQHPQTGAFHVSRNGRPVGEYPALSSLLPYLEWTLLHNALDASRHLHIHAGAVARGGRALLLAGPSGSGKSSLTLGLLLRGCALLSDEIAPVGPEQPAVRPFPRTLCIKAPSLDAFRELDPAGSLDRPGAVLDLGGVRCLSAKHFKRPDPQRATAVCAVVFPTYEPGRPSELIPLSRGRGLGLLMRSALNRRIFPDGGLNLLGRLVENAPCFQLQSGSIRPALDLLYDLFAQTPPCQT